MPSQGLAPLSTNGFQSNGSSVTSHCTACIWDNHTNGLSEVQFPLYGEGQEIRCQHTGETWARWIPVMHAPYRKLLSSAYCIRLIGGYSFFQGNSRRRPLRLYLDPVRSSSLCPRSLTYSSVPNQSTLQSQVYITKQHENTAYRNSHKANHLQSFN